MKQRAGPRKARAWVPHYTFCLNKLVAKNNYAIYHQILFF